MQNRHIDNIFNVNDLNSGLTDEILRTQTDRKQDRNALRRYGDPLPSGIYGDTPNARRGAAGDYCLHIWVSSLIMSYIRIFTSRKPRVILSV